MSKTFGLINKIIPTSFVDGPGNRFVIFLQKCNMNCISCHNPHTIGICNFCGLCAEKCEQKAIKVDKEKRTIVVDENICINCDLCIDICPQNYNPHSKWLEKDFILNKIKNHSPFIEGITVSGGEPTLQHDFIYELFCAIKKDPKLNHLTTFIDTNGNCTLKVWKKLIDVMDSAFVDLKAYDQQLHISISGVDNKKVKNSIKFLHEHNKLYEVRMLLFNTKGTKEIDIVKAGHFIKSVSPEINIRILPFRKHGVRKEFYHLQEPTSNQIEMVAKELKSIGLNVRF